MKDAGCVHFLQWALPRLSMRWPGFKKVRRQVCRRLDKRIAELGLADVESYRKLLEREADEWSVLDALCRVTISRFYRDRIVFDYLSTEVLPVLVYQARRRKSTTFRVWSAGCASGEEPYTMALIHHYLIGTAYPDLGLEIIGTDSDPVMLARAGAGRYQHSSLRELPSAWRQEAFERHGDLSLLKPELREHVDFFNLDIRRSSPRGVFHVILCRNLAFTYFDRPLQRHMVKKFAGKLEQGGVLVCATHEKPPLNESGFEPWLEGMPVFRKK